MKVYDATAKLIAEIIRDARIRDLDQLFTFLRETREHELLFGPEIGAYLDEIYEKGVKLHALESANLAQTAQTRRELVEWLSVQRPAAVQKFLPYMDFREP